MQTYSKFRPSGFDCAGLGCDDQQDWLVAPVAVNRDSDCLQRSNWAVVTEDIQKAGDDDCQIHRFGHWANGWFEIMLVRPESEAAKVAELWENALSEYPVASDDHFSDLETNEAAAYWDHLSLSSRKAECERARVTRFAAYKPFGSLPDRLTERLTEGL